MPELDAADAQRVGDTHATFVTVGGQNINELDAKTDLRGRSSSTFDATAKQPQRSLGAGGSLVLHPDHQEVHLQTLGAADAGRARGSSRRDRQATIQLRRTTPSR